MPRSTAVQRILAKASIIFLTGAAVASAASCASRQNTPIGLVATASAAEPAAALTDTIRDQLRNLAGSSHAPKGATVQVLIPGMEQTITADLTPMRGDNVEGEPGKRTKLIDTAIEDLDRTVRAQTAAVPGLNLLALLVRAQRMQPGADLYVFSSGLQTYDPLSIQDFHWNNFDPKAVAADLNIRGLLPDLRGHRVTYLGLGLAGGTQPQLALPDQRAIERLWMEICRLAGAASCASRPGTGSPTPPLARLPVPVIPVQRPATCATPVQLPAAVLFTGNSAQLGAGADIALRPVAAQLSRCPSGVRVDVRGHAADVIRNRVDGSRLSADRAAAVSSRLLTLGAPATVLGKVRGVGDTQPLVDNWPAGVFNESLAARNRRVELIFRPATR